MKQMIGRILFLFLAVAATATLPLAAQTGAPGPGGASASTPGSVADSIRTMASLGTDELLIIRFTTPGECGKCSLVLREAIVCIGKHLRDRGEIKTMGAIRCERKIELQAYARRNQKEFQFFVRDDGTLLKRLGIGHAADLVVMGADGLILLTGSSTDMAAFCEQVAKTPDRL